jgi:hypothetical protein
MAGIFWLAITLCGFVGFTVFIAPDFATRSWVFCLAKWKSLQLKRARLNELNLFALITRLHAAKRDRYIFLIMSSQLDRLDFRRDLAANSGSNPVASNEQISALGAFSIEDQRYAGNARCRVH